ncbi:hypothetical protein LQW54_011390 [Pestalotiopsis sp. IQ-011]
MSQRERRRLWVEAPPYAPNGLQYDIHRLHLATWLLAGCNLVLDGPPTMDALQDQLAADLAADLETVMSRSTLEQHDKAMRMRSSQEFRNWLETPFSGMIDYVDHEMHQFNTPTSSSIVTRELICSSRPADGRLVLGYFGGLRYPESFIMTTLIGPHPGVRPFQNVQGLMRNLLLQLLLNIPSEFVRLPWTPHVLATSLTEDPVRTFELLHKLFDQLMFQSPAQEIIIVIDNITQINGAGPDFADQLLYKVKAAQNSPNGSRVLKMLITNPLPELQQRMAAAMQGFGASRIR